MAYSENLASALRRLDSRDADLLSLSFERGVPDDALARVYGIDRAELSHRRHAAIDRLAAELGAERGEVLGMLEAGASGRERGAPHLGLALAGLGIAALIAAVALIWAGGGGTSGTQPQFAGPDATFVPAPSPSDRPVAPSRSAERPASSPSAPRPAREAPCHATASIARAATLYRRPGGRPRARVGARTGWGSPRVFGVVRRRDGWLAVQAPELRNGEIGWLPADRARQDCVTWSLHADLSRRLLRVRRDGRVVRKITVAVGSSSNPTPRGRFSVTDKLRVEGGASPYGCCVLALTGRQVRLPPGWPGGDRLAVHATNYESSIGQAVSLGCMRTDSRRARWLIETVPLGTPIFIRS